MWVRWPAPERVFAPSERAAVAEAARRAEGLTSGEVVPFVVGRCDDYRDALWAAAAWGAVIGAAVVSIAHWLRGSWGAPTGLWLTLPVAAGAVLGLLLAGWLPGLRRVLVPPSALQARAERRAALAFLEEEVFATRERTGILIFVALFERRVVVLSDSGINARVEQGAWNEIVAELRQGVRRGRAAEALVAAILACGRLLAEHRVEIRPDDRNELPDELRIADE